MVAVATLLTTTYIYAVFITKFVSPNYTAYKYLVYSDLQVICQRTELENLKMTNQAFD